jgi:hypothetical protein
MRISQSQILKILHHSHLIAALSRAAITTINKAEIYIVNARKMRERSKYVKIEKYSTGTARQIGITE